jgi:hypothetical protein
MIGTDDTVGEARAAWERIRDHAENLGTIG